MLLTDFENPIQETNMYHNVTKCILHTSAQFSHTGSHMCVCTLSLLVNVN